MTLITTEKLLRIAPNLPLARAEVKVRAMNELLPQYEIDILDEFEEYLANVLHETGGFRLREESLNYRPDRLVAIWPRRFSLTPAPGRKLAADFARNPRKLANEVYNGRMGNRPGSNDGWDFRGGGDPQLTGRETYTLFTADSNRRFGTNLTAQQWAERVRTDDYWSTAAGGWFFKWKGLHTLAVSDNIVELRRRWNGGLIGLDDVNDWLEKCKKFL